MAKTVLVPKHAWAAIFLEAAEKVATGFNFYSCLAVRDVETGGRRMDQVVDGAEIWYRLIFNPDHDDLKPWRDGLWTYDIDNNGGRDLRVVMLSLAAAICKTEGV